ncbi:Cap-specific mRNA (nucleoside-2'-O-)-methyltransferase 1 [Armadillidium nasatum]|uniref:Cap-specific mRNA (nucleoside-2'-O-)-methyltransferase 1 n=1 Tax=Armadillidium nasatum TaxID=96803 RepID=A0A5N5TIM1_9CRUS|nr:Cap-specific mRNA (nucleoside-2'-O-)-methyltransferase 1 [Armadillidium nasatum]
MNYRIEPHEKLCSEDDSDEERNDSSSLGFTNSKRKSLIDDNHEISFETSFQSEDNSKEENEEQIAFSSKAQKIMMNMGYEKGKGLGKFKQGIVAPILASNQRGRRGLGFIIEGLEPKNLKWDKSKEHIVVKEEVFWLPQSDDPSPDFQTLLSWVKEGAKKLDISDEIKFCHPKVLQQILSSKSVFDNLPDKELFKARSRSNPFETLGKLFFQNRAALKMANLDAVFDFMFTCPVDENGRSLVGPDELFYFADVCAAPGGFSEYVLWKRKNVSNGFCDAKGFGFTLKENDFKLHDFFAAPAEFFEPHYGINGNQGDGNIYVPSNISNFRSFVLKNTGGKGVHLMMADGGFSVEGEENIQEILSKQLYLCQFLVALGIVRAEFEKTSKKDVVEIVPLEVLQEDEEFYQYICDSNNVFGERQVVGLQKIKAFCQDPSLFEDQQATLRKDCLSFWQLPDRSRVAPERKDPKIKVNDLLSPALLEKLVNVPQDLNINNLANKIHSPYDFRFVFLASPKESTVKERGFFLGLGGPNIFIWNEKDDKRNWHRMDANFNFPPDTIVYGEIVLELRGELKAQRRVRSVHLIDGLVLNGFDVTNMHLVERHNYLKKFAMALNKESRNDLCTIRCKNLYKLEDIESVVKPPLIDWRVMKGANGAARRVYREAEAYEDEPVRYTIPSGIMLLKITQDPWMMAYSKSQKRKYCTSYCEGAFWWWNKGVQVLQIESSDPNQLHLKSLIEHIGETK